MKKLLCLFLLFIVSSLATAGGASQANTDTYARTGIITPDIATSFYTTEQFKITPLGELVVCRGESSFISSACKGTWVNVKDSVPTGSRYVGFNTFVRMGVVVLIVYWK